MEKRNDPPRGAGDKNSSGGNNIIWYLLAVGVITLFAVTLLTNRPKATIPYSDLTILVERSDPERSDPERSDPERSAEQPMGEPNHIQVVTGSGKDLRKVRYSGLHSVVIGRYEITGLATQLVIEPQSPLNKPQIVQVVTNRDPLDSSDGNIRQLLEKHHIPFDNASGPNPLGDWIPLLVITGIIMLFFFIFLRRIGGAGSPMTFGRSRGKLYAQEGLGVTFDDVAGVEEALEEVREVVEFLRFPEKYQTLGGRIPKGVLLVGPPGTGKTLLAKAIAGEAGVPFFSLSGSDFVEMFVGVGAARVRDTFQQAMSKSPCIIFIDELDALGKTRGSGMVGGHDEREQTLNALLVEMDGFESNTGVIVMAATNRPETLDPALLRPGRFDRQVLVDRPDVAGREDVLKVHCRKVKLDESVSLRHVAEITSGFVGADLANLVNEAALLAARKEKKAVSMEEFDEGVERVTAGLEKKQRIIHPDEKLRVAYHESGHALVAYSLPNTDPVHKVSIIPRGLAALGYTMQRPEGDRFLMTQGELDSRIQVLLAGTIAEEIIFEDISTGAQNDLERASDIARRMVMDFGMSRLGRVNYRKSGANVFLAGGEGPQEHSYSEQTAREIDQEVHRIIEASIGKVRQILEVRRASLEALSLRLIEKEVIDSSELKEIVDETSSSPLLVPGTTVERKQTPEAEKLGESLDLEAPEEKAAGSD